MLKTGTRRFLYMFAKQKYFNRATHSAYGCSSCTANCIRHRFQITQFLTKKLWARIPLQIGDSATAVFPYLCVSFHKICVSVSLKFKFDQHFVRRVLRSRLISETREL